MTTTREFFVDVPRCFERRCRHLIGVVQTSERESTERVACRAFPDGIPDKIAYGDDLHLVSEPGDGGVVYDRSDDEDLEKRAKVSPASVSYVDQSSHPAECCANCVMFRDSDDDKLLGSCTMVEGDINPRGWCKEYYEE